MKELLKDYKKRKREIKKRLQHFRRIYKKSNKDIFAELCFCILTPQTRATVCNKAVKNLQKTGILFKGYQKDIRFYLKGVRFPNNKAKYIIAARNFFKNSGNLDIKSKLDTKDLYRTRDWLVKNIKGLGYKEAGHFLRNIGFGEDIAILDSHILKNLKNYEVIEKIPKSLTKKEYIEIEDKMRGFSRKINIPIDELDLLFWSKETGMVFK